MNDTIDNGNQGPANQGPVERPFQADVARLLDLVVHSIYSDRDIFLRELISNAADACEKLRFEATTQSLATAPFRISIEADKDARTLTIEDNGVGMNSADLDSALGVIANSGTRAFLEKLEGAKGATPAESLIGRFGIGFYSSFIVADSVDVFTRRAGETQGWKWSSDGKGAYAIAPSDDCPDHGARVVLHLKADADAYLDPAKLEAVVAEHSAGVPVPISVREKSGESHEVSDGAALWTRPRADITPEQYKDLYQTISGQFDEPARTIHWRAEGRHNTQRRRPAGAARKSRSGRSSPPGQLRIV